MSIFFSSHVINSADDKAVKYSEIESPSIFFRDVSKVLLPIHWKSHKIMSEGMNEIQSPPYSPDLNMSSKDIGTSYGVQLQPFQIIKKFSVCINGLVSIERSVFFIIIKLLLSICVFSYTVHFSLRKEP